jgi:hypothetical protein
VNNFYLDGSLKQKQKSDYPALRGFNLLNRFGDTGRYILLEVQLLLRNKRPRQALMMLPIIIIYLIFIFTRDKNLGGPFNTIFVSAILLGFGQLIYGQFLFSWESTYYDGIMARKLIIEKYLFAKYCILIFLSVITAIPLSIVFIHLKLVDPILLVALLLFNLGVVPFVILYIGTFNDARIDLAKKQMFNYQGIRGTQFITSFVFMLLPLGIYALFNYISGYWGALLALLIPGLLFFIMHRWWIAQIIKPQLYKRKFRNLEGFRKLNA